jgi:ABC-type multidrug transport system permease subunit
MEVIKFVIDYYLKDYNAITKGENLNYSIEKYLIVINILLIVSVLVLVFASTSAHSVLAILFILMGI